MIPVTLHGPRCSIGCTGPGAPLGGGTPGSTTGLTIAHADGAVDSAAAKTAVKQAIPVRGTARISD
jgi:hypothetical protein